MSKFLYSFVALLSLSTLLQAQTPCGTVLSPEMKARLIDYHANPEKYTASHTTRTVYYLPLKIHIVGDDNGVGYYQLKYLWDLLCTVNKQFEETGFYFYLYGDVHYIANTDYYAHDWDAGYQMMAYNNVPNVTNVYIVEDPAGNCGYYTYDADAIAIAKSCSGAESTTLAHELGHYFSLPHPFDNVQDILEYVDGSNCDDGGDLFCDTRADILDYRWPCPYNGNDTDPHGDPYNPDETLYMSYAYDHCSNRFSNEQMDAMINNLLWYREDLLTHPDPSTLVISDSAILTNPLEGADNIPHSFVPLEWNAVANATFYHVQVTKYSSFAAPLAVNHTIDNNALTVVLEPDEEYMWRVRPLSEGYTCTEYSDFGTFKTVMGTGITTIPSEENTILVYPTLLSSSQLVYVNATMQSPGEIVMGIYSVNGMHIRSEAFAAGTGTNQFTIDASQLSPGIYFLTVQTEGNTYRQKFIIAE